MKLIKIYNCPVCNSNIKKQKKLNLDYKINSFYEKYINFHYKDSLNKIKTVKCKKCYSFVNDYWFPSNELFKIYNVIYPQHHRGWKNFYNQLKFKKTNKLHLKVLKIFNLLKVKDYTEFNTPFSGIFMNIISKNYKMKNFKNLIKLSFDLLKINQLSNKKKNLYSEAFKKYKTISNKINRLQIKTKFNKNLLIDNTFGCWGYGDISNGVNSRSLSNLIFDLKTININEIDLKKFKTDLFFFADSLDHSSKPKYLLESAIKSSKLVLILSNSSANITRQHLFSLSSKFHIYLNRKYFSKILINDKETNSLLIAVTKNKNIINKIK